MQPGYLSMTLVQTSPLDYTQIFALRGKAYHQAMQQFPVVRQLELATMVAYAAMQPGMHVLDCPSGGGYLYPYCPADTHLVEADTAFTLSHSYPTHRLAIQHMDRLPLPNGSMDRVISLAGVHHQSNRKLLYQAWARVLKPGGILAMADVWQGSDTGGFLNGFVHQYNPMGHEGDFLTATDFSQLEQAGFTLKRVEDHTVDWCFASYAEAWAYMGNLFYLSQCPDVQVFIQGLKKHFDLRHTSTSLVVPWTLKYIQAIKI
jgi:SAM-dependent methyltransferase